MIKQTCCIFLLSAVIVACSDGGGSNASSGVYIVPAGPGTPASEYAVSDVKAEASAGVFRLDYTMPLLLVGTSQRVSLRGPIDASGQSATVSGSAGSATCHLAPEAGISLHCDEVLTGITVDLTAVERVAATSDPTNAQAYVSVASRFSSEPIGILEQRE